MTINNQTVRLLYCVLDNIYRGYTRYRHHYTDLTVVCACVRVCASRKVTGSYLTLEKSRISL